MSTGHYNSLFKDSDFFGHCLIYFSQIQRKIQKGSLIIRLTEFVAIRNSSENREFLNLEEMIES